jgi:hypothetical protein
MFAKWRNLGQSGHTAAKKCFCDSFIYFILQKNVSNLTNVECTLTLGFTCLKLGFTYLKLGFPCLKLGFTCLKLGFTCLKLGEP